MNTADKCMGIFTDNQLIQVRQLFLLASVCECWSTSSDVHVALPMMQQVLAPKVYLKYTELQGMEATKAASLNLYECPYCQYPAEVGGSGVYVKDVCPRSPSEVGCVQVDGDLRWFRCPSCSKETCVQCREDKHPDITCDQVRRGALDCPGP
jgi:hypothetical protein